MLLRGRELAGLNTVHLRLGFGYGNVQLSTRLSVPQLLQCTPIEAFYQATIYAQFEP